MGFDHGVKTSSAWLVFAAIDMMYALSGARRELIKIVPHGDWVVDPSPTVNCNASKTLKGRGSM